MSHIHSNFVFQRICCGKYSLKVGDLNFFPFQYYFYFYSCVSYLVFWTDSKVIIYNTSWNCLLFQTRPLYTCRASCFSEEMHSVQILRPMGNCSARNIFQFLLGFSMECCYYIKAMQGEALIIFLLFGKFQTNIQIVFILLHGKGWITMQTFSEVLTGGVEFLKNFFYSLVTNTLHNWQVFKILNKVFIINLAETIL